MKIENLEIHINPDNEQLFGIGNIALEINEETISITVQIAGDIPSAKKYMESYTNHVTMLLRKRLKSVSFEKI